MKIFDISDALSRLKQTLVRFPVAVLFSLSYFAVLVFALGECFDKVFEQNIQRFSFVLPLGFVLSLGIRLFTEDIGGKWRNLAEILVIPLMAAYFFVITEDENSTLFIRHALFCITALLFLCIAPICSTGPAFNLWQYNVKIWLRVAFSILFSGILFGGFSLALLAIDTLFNFYIDGKIYAYLASFCYSVFAPLFFLAGIPKGDTSYDTEKNYPLLNILGQYILPPILATYLVILYVYGLKILVTWNLPNGWVSSLVLVYAGGGIFTYFLLHNNYLKGISKISVWFGKYFFPSVIPLLLLLFIAIVRRLCDYGFTEERYFVFVAALWLTCITAWMTVTRGSRFRPVILSLAVVALLSAVGPWSSFNVSGKSQLNRLTALLADNNLLENGKWIQHEPVVGLPDSIYNNIESIVKYFTGNETDEQYLFPLLSNISNELQDAGKWNRRHEMMKYLKSINTGSIHHFWVNAPGLDNRILTVKGYDVLFGKSYHGYDYGAEVSQRDTAAYALHIGKQLQMELYRYGELHYSYDLRTIADSLMRNIEFDKNDYYHIELKEPLTYIDKHTLLTITGISGMYTPDSTKYRYDGLDLLLLWKD